MSNKTTKLLSERDANQILQMAGNDVDASLTVTGFVSAKVGNSVVRTVIDAVTDDYSFYDSTTTLLYTLRIVYNNSTHDEVNSATRTV